MSEHPTKFCPTCGHSLPDFPFKVGDSVQHMNGCMGIVDRVGAAVEVQYGEEVGRGIYDRGWFESFPAGLRKVERSISQPSNR